MAGKKAEMWFSDYQTENVCLDIRIEKSFIRDKVNISV